MNKHLLTCLTLASLLASPTSHAAVRCTNAAGAVAYADAACPAGYQVAGTVAAMPPVSAADQALARQQAAQDQAKLAALEKQRRADENQAAKARMAANKQGSGGSKSGSAKSCKTAELALKRAQNAFDDAPSSSTKHAKSSKKSQSQTHTVIRDGDDKTSKAKNKARKKLDLAQAKRDLACG